MEERSVALCGGKRSLQGDLASHTLVSLMKALLIMDFELDLLHNLLEVVQGGIDFGALLPDGELLHLLLVLELQHHVRQIVLQLF